MRLDASRHSQQYNSRQSVGVLNFAGEIRNRRVALQAGWNGKIHSEGTQLTRTYTENVGISRVDPAQRALGGEQS